MCFLLNLLANFVTSVPFGSMEGQAAAAFQTFFYTVEPRGESLA